MKIRKTFHDSLRFLQIPLWGLGGFLLFSSCAGQKETEEQLLVNACQYKHRLDDFAWENGSAIWRAYGPKLQSIGEKSYGYDVWTKNTSEMLMDARYLQDSIMEARCDSLYDLGLDDKADSLKLVMSYHYDHGTGLDCYSVGSTLGCGAPALMMNDSLLMPWCYESYEILEQTPEHVAFRLTYPQFELEGMTLQENRVISVDAGTRFCKSDVTFNLVSGEKKDISGLRLAAGVILHDEDSASLKMEKKAHGAFVAYADPTDRPDEDLGKVMVGLWMPDTDSAVETKIVQQHATLSVPYSVGQTVTYYFGSGWSKGDCPTLNQMIEELTSLSSR